MPQTPGKRGLPRKYDTPEEKAKREAVAKRARRRLQKPLAHGDIRFRIYVPPLMQSYRPRHYRILGLTLQTL
ncbi:hypothetical protein IWW34DRAFT_753232 [Fusarium oxysporum f. sp. albedinis]|nr:hypothetical protein IWW34DRAFT_753232 [Fusarium oxysporum f. sp. albedinis]KAK2471140.1 hypothetical protein H9L39_17371 [Fusarium oxysporum f. sp. albedinis]